MAECSRHPGNVLPGCHYCRYGVEPASPALVTDIEIAMLAQGADVMLRVNGEVFACTQASLVFEGGRYVLMLDGEARG